MKSEQFNDNNAIEIDGIRFQTLMPKRLVTIPASQSDSLIDVKVDLGIHIRNNTTNAFCFCLYGTITPELIMPDGQRGRGGEFSDWLVAPKKSDFAIANPGRTVTYFPDVVISKNYENQLYLKVWFGNGSYWLCNSLYAGTYQIRLKYRNVAKKARVYDPDIDKNKLIENIWTGEALMPFIEFSLVCP